MANNEPLKKRRASKITEKQQTYVDAVMVGTPPQQAAAAAGSRDAWQLEKSRTVKEAIAEARAELSDLTKITRLDVIEGMMDGIQLARFQADAGNVIKGWVEVAKILGHYAPEVKRVELTLKENRINDHLRSLPLEELMRIASGESTDQITIDGVYQKIN